MGFGSPVSRSTLADPHAERTWRIWGDLAALCIWRARELYVNTGFGVELSTTVYALAAPTIALGLSLFPWAPVRTATAAVTRHTLPTCAATFRRSFISQMANPTKSMCWICWPSKPVRFTAWIEARWISVNCSRYIKQARSS